MEKTRTLRPPKKLYGKLALIAFIMAFIMFVPFIISDKGYFLFYGDYNVQQIPFYQLCHDSIRSGNFGWSRITDLGSNFISSYSFYTLGSPFFWLTIPFPNWFVPYLMGPLYIIKFTCAALAAYAYLSRFVKNQNGALIGSIMYAFSGFSVYNIFFNHFHEPMIFFPLLLLGIELYMAENKKGFLAASVFLCAVSNYFFFFGMVVFAIIYWFVRVLSRAWTVTVKRFFGFAFETVLGVLMAGVLLVPTIMAITGMNRVSDMLSGWNAICYGKEQIYLNIIEVFFFPSDLPARPVFFPGADVKWSSLGGWLPVVSMTGVFAFMQAKKGHWLRRVIGILIVMAMFPILNSAFYMFNTAYYARWFYMPILMMCLATIMAFEDKEVNWRSGFKWTFSITAVIALVVGLFPQKNEEGKWVFGLYTDAASSNPDYTYLKRFLVTCLIAFAGLIVFRILIPIMKEHRKMFYRITLACVCVLSVVSGMFFIFTGKSHSYSDSVMNDLIDGSVYFEEDTNQFRTDVYSDWVDNTAMFLGLSSVNCFHSIVPSSSVDFWEYVGEERGVASRPSTTTYAARDLLSVKYVLNHKEAESFENEDGTTKMPGYNYKYTSNGYKVYENTNYIPYGFTYDYYMTDDECKVYGTQYRDAMMLKAIKLTPVQVSRYGYMMKDIGEDYNTTLSTEDSETKLPLLFEDADIAADCAARTANTCSDLKWSNSGFSTTVSLDKANLVFFSIPFEEGWSAKVDGKTVKIEKVNEGFMAIAVPIGGNTKIEFSYKTPGLSAGVKISIVSFAVFALYLLIVILLKKRREDEEIIEYPEGEVLKEIWSDIEGEEEYTLKEDEDDYFYSDIDSFIPDDIRKSLIREDDMHKDSDDGFDIDLSFLEDDGEEKK